MAITQADLDALDAAIAAGKGAKAITFADGQTVQLSTIKEMLDLRAFLARQIDASASPAYRLAVTKKGT